MDIVEVARRSGVPASTLRFYEEKGVIRSIGRQGLRRVFAPKVLEQLALVALGRAAGFSLNEIAGMFTPDGKPTIDRDRLVEKADELDGAIRKLATMRDGLRHAAACTAPSHLVCPKFRRLMGIASAEVAQERGRKKRAGTSVDQRPPSAQRARKAGAGK